jgi:hypothetical protein
VREFTPSRSVAWAIGDALWHRFCRIPTRRFAVDFQSDQEMAGINSYRVEVSGWDALDAFFVEKTTLDWSGGDEKEISLRSDLREGAVVFVRLLQQLGKVDSFPIAYRASCVKVGENGRTLVQLARLHPRAPLKETTGVADGSQSKVA